MKSAQPNSERCPPRGSFRRVMHKRTVGWVVEPGNSLVDEAEDGDNQEDNYKGVTQSRLLSAGGIYCTVTCSRSICRFPQPSFTALKLRSIIRVIGVTVRTPFYKLEFSSIYVRILYVKKFQTLDFSFASI